MLILGSAATASRAEGAAAPCLLVVDDDVELCAVFELRLASAGYRTRRATNAAEALAVLGHAPRIDAVLLDCVLPDMEGVSLISSLLGLDPRLPIIMITADGSIDGAIAAVKGGAYHYCTKPLDLRALLNVIQRALEARQMRRELDALKRVSGSPSFADLIGESSAMLSVKATLQKVATSGHAATILLTGETGTGKDLAARVLHATGPRAAGPFVNVTCSAVPGGLSESELFGHERGAFTDAKERKPGLVELAAGGTLFLDEVGELPVGVQAKLLRVLEERAMRRVGGVRDVHVDVRVIAATNRDLGEQIKRGRFREDLYYRLAVVPIHMPPLRERARDVLLLADAFLRHFTADPIVDFRAVANGRGLTGRRSTAGTPRQSSLDARRMAQGCLALRLLFVLLKCRQVWGLKGAQRKLRRGGTRCARVRWGRGRSSRLTKCSGPAIRRRRSSMGPWSRT